MFALGGDRSGRAVGEAHDPSGGHSVVLPRPLRRAVRLARAAALGHLDVPRYLVVASVAVLFGATGVYGVVLGGHAHSVLETTSTALGFGIDKVNVKGNVETSDIDVLQQLKLDGDTSILTFNVHSAREALLKLPWVKDAKVRKVYPGTVDISLKERKAFAIWQHGKDLSLIQRSGSVIAPYVQGSQFSGLPLVVGLGADTAAAGFEGLLANWPDLKKRVKAVVRVSDRRWNLVFDNNVTVKLPEAHVAQALEDLSVMQRQRKILSRAIVAVDLRLPDRITIQLTQQAAADRKAAIEARDKAFKKAEHDAWNNTKASKQA